MPRILIERDGAILTLTLNRPDKLNAIDGAMLDALGEALGADRAGSRGARGDPDRCRARVQRRRGHQGVDGAHAARVRPQLGPARPCPVRSARGAAAAGDRRAERHRVRRRAGAGAVRRHPDRERRGAARPARGDHRGAARLGRHPAPAAADRARAGQAHDPHRPADRRGASRGLGPGQRGGRAGRPAGPRQGAGGADRGQRSALGPGGQASGRCGLAGHARGDPRELMPGRCAARPRTPRRAARRSSSAARRATTGAERPRRAVRTPRLGGAIERAARRARRWSRPIWIATATPRCSARCCSSCSACRCPARPC